MSFPRDPELLTIPEPEDGEVHPGYIAPGHYSLADLVELLHQHAENPAAIRFIADML